MYNNIKKGLAAALALAFVLCATGCGAVPNLLQEAISVSSSSSSSQSSSKPTLADIRSSSSSQSSSGSSSGSSESEDDKDPAKDSYQNTVKSVQKRMLSDTIKYYELNSDTVAWLYVPGTTVDDSVVRNPATDTTNSYYLRRTNLGVESTGKYSEGWYGCYYTDYRTVLGNRLNLSKNCVIYGHSMTDNADGVKFAQLNAFRDIGFAQTHPYIYFSTIESEMVWQVFAVFYSRTDFKYNMPNPNAEQFYAITEEAKARSFFDFGTTVSVTDKILTLSTCTYNVVDEYPNDYRMVVMAKLLDANATLTDTIPVSLNADHLLPDEIAPQFDLYKNATPETIAAKEKEESSAAVED